MLLHHSLNLSNSLFLSSHGVMELIATQQSRQANLILNPSLDGKISLRKTDLTKELVHFLQCEAFGLGNVEVNPEGTNGGDGSEEYEGAELGFTDEVGG